MRGEFDAAIGKKSGRENDIAADRGAAGVDGGLAAAFEFAAATSEAATDCRADEPHLAECAEIVAELNVAGDLGVVEVESHALLLDVFGLHSVEGEAAAEIEIAADVGIDEIEAAEHASREQINVLRDLHGAGLNGSGAAIADIELLQLCVADVDAVVEQAIVEREREWDVRCGKGRACRRCSRRGATRRDWARVSSRPASVQSQMIRSAFSVGTRRPRTDGSSGSNVVSADGRRSAQSLVATAVKNLASVSVSSAPNLSRARSHQRRLVGPHAGQLFFGRSGCLRLWHAAA